MGDFTEIVSRTEEFDLKQRESESIITGMNDGGMVYCSFEPETDDDKRRMFNAISGDGLPIIENTGKPLALVDVAIQPVELTNDDGTTSVCPRISMLTADGNVYVATSWGLYKAMQRINALYGGLHFDPKKPLTVEAVRIKTKKGQTINLKVL